MKKNIYYRDNKTLTTVVYHFLPLPLPILYHLIIPQNTLKPPHRKAEKDSTQMVETTKHTSYQTFNSICVGVL